MPIPATSSEQIHRLHSVGYVTLPEFVPRQQIERLRNAAMSQLLAGQPPLELEADLQYPGAPATRTAVGGGTVRRLLDAYGRDAAFAQQATAPPVRDWMQAYFGEPAVLSRAHHNCVMTKHPRYGSLTGWHRDVRYWSFQRPDLVSIWIALGLEEARNGALWFVPGSNRLALDDDCFDEAKFFKNDRPDNVQLIASAESPRLAAGDAVFFHCNTLHSAGPNLSDNVKLSLVYTYHGQSNAAIANTRTASVSEVAL